jgi:hypothetical protein
MAIDLRSFMESSSQASAEPIKNRNLAVRTPEPLFEQLAGLSIIDDVSLGQTIRNAMEAYIKNRREAPGFEAELAAAKARKVDTLGFPPPASAEL